jgi:hypothetical protein
MRIGIDGYNLAIPNGTGVATYGLRWRASRQIWATGSKRCSASTRAAIPRYAKRCF